MEEADTDRLAKICYSLVNFYNASILKHIPIQLKQAFVRECNINKDEDGIERKILLKLISNYIDDNRPNVGFIGGPKTLTLHWSEKYKKLIYIFGEDHLKPIDCDKYGIQRNQLPIDDYLYELIVNSSCFIDLYFEFPAFGAKQIAYDSEYNYGGFNKGRLKDLITRFKICVEKNTRDTAPQCRLSRIHYFDIRKRYKKDKTVELSQISIFRHKILVCLSKKEIFQKITSFKHLMLSDGEFMNVFSNINNITESEIRTYTEFWTSQIRNNKFVMKKLNRSTMKKEILEFLNEKMLEKCTRRIDRFNKYTQIINTIGISDKIFISAWEKIMKLIITLEALEADAYLLGRLFKQFDTSKRPSDEPVKPHNIIIYAGDGHSILYRQFLKSIGFKKIESTKKGDFENCIDMTGITQPLFSEWPATRFDMDDGEDKNNYADIGYKSGEDEDEDMGDQDMGDEDEDLVYEDMQDEDQDEYEYEYEDQDEDEDEDEDEEEESNIDINIDYDGEDVSKVNQETLFPKDIFGQYGNFSNETTNEKQSTKKNRPNPYANSKERRRL